MEIRSDEKAYLALGFPAVFKRGWWLALGVRAIVIVACAISASITWTLQSLPLMMEIGFIGTLLLFVVSLICLELNMERTCRRFETMERSSGVMWSVKWKSLLQHDGLVISVLVVLAVVTPIPIAAMWSIGFALGVTVGEVAFLMWRT